MEGKRQVVLFDSSDGEVSLDVAVDVTQEDVWLTKNQMGLLFGRDRTVISRHVSNIYREGGHGVSRDELHHERLAGNKNARHTVLPGVLNNDSQAVRLLEA